MKSLFLILLYQLLISIILSDEIVTNDGQCNNKKFKLCKQISINCMECNLNEETSKDVDCIYGEEFETECRVKDNVQCKVEKI
jgi:hypothetical protein